MTGKRKRYSADFKAKVALEALRGELTRHSWPAKHGVHQTMISEWKRQAVAGWRRCLRARRRERRHPGRRVGEAAREDRAAGGGTGFFVEGVRAMSVERRRADDRSDHRHLSVVRQCALVSIGRSTFYRAPTPDTAENLELMRLLDEQFLETPWYGSRQMARHLRPLGHVVGRKRVRRCGQDGSCYDLSTTAHDGSAPRPGSIRISPQPGGQPAEPSLVRGPHVYPDAPGLSVSCRGDGLGDASGAELALVEHDGRGFLHPRRWKRRWRGSGGRRYSTATRGAGSPRHGSPRC